MERFILSVRVAVIYSGLLVLCLAASGCSKADTGFSQQPTQIKIRQNAININKASAAELEELPYIGVKTANEIVRYRRVFGKFRRAEHLLLVKGISDKRFRKIRSMIKIK